MPDSPAVHSPNVVGREYNFNTLNNQIFFHCSCVLNYIFTVGEPLNPSSWPQVARAKRAPPDGYEVRS